MIKPGKFTFKVTTPMERLSTLQEEYNSQEFELYTPDWDLMMNNLYTEMQEIIYLNPELGPLNLKSYTH